MRQVGEQNGSDNAGPGHIGVVAVYQVDLEVHRTVRCVRVVHRWQVSSDGEKTAWFKDSEGNTLAIGSSV